MEICFDYEAIKNAGGAVYSKYGSVKNSKDLKLPEELRKALGDDTWIREVGPGTIDLESGDMTAFEEQLIGEYKGDNCLRLLRMCNLVGKESNAYVAGLAKLRPYNMVNYMMSEKPDDVKKTKEKSKYVIDVHFPQGFDLDAYRKNQILAMRVDREERACNKEEILKILRGQGQHQMALYLSPWRWTAYQRKWDEIADTFETYSSELKSRILEMYLDISGMEEVSPGNRLVIYQWASRRLWEQPYVDDKVKACRCYSILAEKSKNKDYKIIYRNRLSELRNNMEEESFLILKRLDSFDVPEVPYYLGIKYLEGYGCERNYQEAKRYFVKGTGQGSEELKELCFGMISYATRKGDSYELFKIAMRKLETDKFEEGMEQLKRLADVDKLEDAQYELAKLYENGYRIKKDEEQAFKYYEKAAGEGFEPAIRKLIQVYEKQQLGLDRKGWRDKNAYPERLEKWKRRLNYPAQKNYKTM